MKWEKPYSRLTLSLPLEPIFTERLSLREMREDDNQANPWSLELRHAGPKRNNLTASGLHARSTAVCFEVRSEIAMPVARSLFLHHRGPQITRNTVLLTTRVQFGQVVDQSLIVELVCAS